MGLAIVERIVQEHGGKVAFCSKAEVGTTVEISLPTKPLLQTDRKGVSVKVKGIS